MRSMMHNVVKLMVFVCGFSAVFAGLSIVVRAADVIPPELVGLLDDVVVVFGAVTLGWLSVQRGAIHVLKGIKIGDKLLLDTPTKIWLANGVLAVLGLILASTQSGQSIWASAIQAVLAFLAASGLHEFNTKAGKSSESNRTGTELTA